MKKHFETAAGSCGASICHNGAMWPIHGAYRCRQCLRTRQVPWNESTYATRAAGLR